MYNDEYFDPELRKAVEDGRKNTKRILDLIDNCKDMNSKVLCLKNALLAYGRPDENIKQTVLHEQIMIPQSNGNGFIRLLIYRPQLQHHLLPCIYHIHSGGMISGNIDSEMEELSKLSNTLEAIVVDVDYRLAPEHPYPAGMEDCYDGLKWIWDHGKSLQIDTSRIGLMGESAGGGLAASIAIKSRDSGGPKILFQALIAPMLDDRNITSSSRLCSGAWPSWPREMNLLGWYALLGDMVGTSNVSQYAAPSRANYLGNLPPSYIEVGGMEVFRDEDIDYASKMMANNVPVELHVYPGTFHSWHSQAPDAGVTKRAIYNRIEWIRNHLRS